MKTYQVVVIPGDGIGPEIVEAALEVLDAVQERTGAFALELERIEAGAKSYLETGLNISSETVDACLRADAVLKGPAGLPGVRLADGTEAGLIGGVLRRRLDTYANVRPIKLWPGVTAPLKLKIGEVDYVIVRENTEGLYASRGNGVMNWSAAVDSLFMTRPGVERICRYAFDLARKRDGAPLDGVKRVTCVDKSNVLKSFGFFRSIFEEVADQYPDIEADYLYADAAAQDLVMRPGQFDVMVMENFLGDILSDLGGGTVGGIGICPPGNIGDENAYFEPIHGSAPSIGGTGTANPLGQILAAAMMLEHLGETSAAQLMEQAVWEVLSTGALVIGADGRPVGGTTAATKQIIQQVNTSSA